MPRFSQQVLSALSNPQAGMLTGQALANVGGRLAQIPENIRVKQEAEKKKQGQQAMLSALASGNLQNITETLGTFGATDPTLGAALATQAGDLTAQQKERKQQAALADVYSAAADGTNITNLKPLIETAKTLGVSGEDIAENVSKGQEFFNKQFGTPVTVEELDQNGDLITVRYKTKTDGSVITESRQELGAKKTKETGKYSIQKDDDGYFYIFNTLTGKIGTPFETKEAAAKKVKETQKSQEAIIKANAVRGTIDKARTLLQKSVDAGFFGELGGVGGWKGLLKILPSTEARTLEKYLTSIRANVGFDQLLTIKDSGSTLGQVSNIENTLLQSTIASLDSLDSAEGILEAIDKIDGYYNSIIAKESMGIKAPLAEWGPVVDWSNEDFRREFELRGGEVIVQDENTYFVKTPDNEAIQIILGN